MRNNNTESNKDSNIRENEVQVPRETWDTNGDGRWVCPQDIEWYSEATKPTEVVGVDPAPVNLVVKKRLPDSDGDYKPLTEPKLVMEIAYQPCHRNTPQIRTIRLWASPVAACS